MFNYIELFAGIGGFRTAFDTVGGKCVFASEIDKYAAQSYKALYNGAPELHGDITKVDAHSIPDHDILLGGFPCQAFSVAGKRAGFDDARGTLFFEIIRIANVKRPALMLLENVKGLLSHDRGKTFQTMCEIMDDIGYAIDFKVLNSKHYGVPQNRERIFIVASRDVGHAEWTISGNSVESKAKKAAKEYGVKTFNFDWPKNDTVTVRLRDILEPSVPEKYYLSDEKAAALIAQLELHGPCILQMPRGKNKGGLHEEAPTLTSNAYQENHRVVEPIMIGHVEGISGHDICRRVYSVDGVSPTVPTGSSGNTTPKILMPYTVFQKTTSWTTTIKHDEVGTLQAARLDKVPQVVTPEVRPVLTPDRVAKQQNGRRFKEDDEESYTLTAQDTHGVAIGHYPAYRIRKLTPLECWRLQGFTDKQFYKAKYFTLEEAKNMVRVSRRDIPMNTRLERISDSQLYKQAGNAVTVNVIGALAARMLPMIDSELWEVLYA
ncbi:DNA (cytosine-5-)-methyltransferase [Paenibacillus sp. TAB 01]|uniref:DNA (cytosine-5-)-methyltransferase n=1 Tax=Paenibacillus sp. TAB 01 TaxID=3368988 RepID=UPI003751F4AA